MLWHGKNFRGIINKAKEMIFNNTGTNLVSTNAEDAIKELDNKVTEEYVETTALSSDTNRSVLNRLYGLIDRSKLTDKARLVYTATNGNQYIGYVNYVNDTTIRASVNINSTADLTIDGYMLANTSYFVRFTVQPSGTTKNDYSGSAANAGDVYRFYY